MAVHIESVECSAWVAAKLNREHQLSIYDVEDALESIIRAGWVEDEEHGRRLIAKCQTARGLLRVFLYPIDENAGTFRLGSAFY